MNQKRHCCQPEPESLTLHLQRKFFMLFQPDILVAEKSWKRMFVDRSWECSTDGRWVRGSPGPELALHVPLLLFTSGVKPRTRWRALTCGRSYDVPGGGLGHGVGQSLPEALFTGVCRANVVPGNAKTFRPASVHFQQGDAAPIKWTCNQEVMIYDPHRKKKQSLVT